MRLEPTAYISLCVPIEYGPLFGIGQIWVPPLLFYYELYDPEQIFELLLTCFLMYVYLDTQILNKCQLSLEKHPWGQEWCLLSSFLLALPSKRIYIQPLLTILTATSLQMILVPIALAKMVAVHPQLLLTRLRPGLQSILHTEARVTLLNKMMGSHIDLKTFQ